MFNRRNFLHLTGGFTTSLILQKILPVSAKNINLNNYLEGDIINLELNETSLRINNKQAKATLLNQSLPAPTLRFKEGQLATIKLTNNLLQTTSIHWHGIILPQNMDGVPGLSFRGVKPGETFTYQFPLKQSGTYWYHSHSGMQEPLGMYGAIIIDPLEPDPFKYDKDYVILLSDWSFEDPHQILANLKKMPTYYNYQRRTITHLAEDWEWKRMRMEASDIADVTGATYTYLMNGKTSEDNWTGIFQPGEKVRLRLINGSAMTFFDVRLPQLRMTVVQADGQNVQPITVDELRIGVGETYDVIVEPTTEDAYTIFAETMDRSGYVKGTLAIKEGLSAAIPPRRERPLRTMTDMGMNHDHSNHNSSTSEQTEHSNHQTLSLNSNHQSSSSIHSEHSDQNIHNHHNITESEPLDFSWQPRGNDNNGIGNAVTPQMVKNRLNEPGIGLDNSPHRVLVYTDLKSFKPLENKRKSDREIVIHLTGNMERYQWSFDGKKYSEEKEIIFYYGERLRLTFINDTMMEHPIHLHGMWLEIVNGNGIYQPRKHTLIVKPSEKVSTEIDVDAKGKWAFHCHLLYHMDVGMFRTIKVIG